MCRKKNLIIFIENKEDEKAHESIKAQGIKKRKQNPYVKNNPRNKEAEINEDDPGKAPINIDAKNYEVRLLKK